MKQLQPLSFDLEQCRQELDAFSKLLAGKVELSEQNDLQPLLKTFRSLVALFGTQVPGIGLADRFAFEFDVFGNYTADLVIGRAETGTYCAIEFEDARESSVFHQTASRAQKEWGRRFEHGFGQLIDWFHAFDDQKNTAEFSKHFGTGHVAFYGALLIGRLGHLTDYDRARLRWRSDRVTINTHKVACWTYDELLAALDRQWQLFSLMSQKPQGNP